jgi:hypothetical protein
MRAQLYEGGTEILDRPSFLARLRLHECILSSYLVLGIRRAACIDEDTKKILGLLDLSGILIPYIYTVLYPACREEFYPGEEFSQENSS